MKIYLDVLIVDDGKASRHRFLEKEVTVDEFNGQQHWNSIFFWDDLVPGEMEVGGKNVRVSAIKNGVRVWRTPEFTPEEGELLKKQGKLATLTDLLATLKDLSEKTNITYEGNYKTGNSL